MWEPGLYFSTELTGANLLGGGTTLRCTAARILDQVKRQLQLIIRESPLIRFTSPLALKRSRAAELSGAGRKTTGRYAIILAIS